MTLMLAPSRRGFLKAGLVGGAFMLATTRDALAADAAMPEPAKLGLYVRIAPDNRITIGTGTTEIGQGTNTSIPMLIAEELDVDFGAVAVEMVGPAYMVGADGKLADAHFSSGAGGSTAINESYDTARQAGAAVRHMLLTAAAKSWNVPLAELSTARGVVRHAASGRTAPYGQLAALAAAEPLPAGPLPLKKRAEHRIIGTPQKQKQALAIVTGQPLYGIDQRVEGMLHAVVLRSPYLGGTLKSLDERAARKVAGVRAVVRMPRPPLDAPWRGNYLGEGIAVVADSLWTARKARDLLEAQWSPGPTQESTSADYAAALAALTRGEGFVLREEGNFADAFQRAAKVIEATYEAPLVAHATMEPQNSIAQPLEGGRWRVITPTQSPLAALQVAASVAGVKPEAVELVPVRSGGGFGRRLFLDPIAEAVFIARSVGRPIKLVWTRECDTTSDLYRPGGIHLLRAGVDRDGRLTAWEHRAASQPALHRNAPVKDAQLGAVELFPDDHPGALAPARRISYLPMKSAAPRGWWRAPGHTVAAWVQQSFLDEIAAACGQDPLAYRLGLLGAPRELPYRHHGGPVFSTGRLAAVLELAAKRAGWDGRTSAAQGRGRGIAGHYSFGSYVAHVVDVSMKAEGGFSVDRVVSAVDCGIAVNPNGVAMQNEGAINDALSTALGQAITIKEGRVEQANFDAYEMMRIDRAACAIETHIVPSEAAPSGMGEPAMPPFTPALTNALHAASGKRIRKLPIGSQLA
jgi:isoquinoline 1-oxidoreductase beta subunit